MLTATNSDESGVTCIIVGDDGVAECRELLSWLRRYREIRILATFPGIRAAIAGGLGESVRAGLVLVLQSWSDEYTASEVELLIGRTLFSHVLCCYGSWCESDGRTRDQWPGGLRVPIRFARSIVDAEIGKIRRLHAPQPPTASVEEVFSARCDDLEYRPLSRSMHRAGILIVCDDYVLRETAAVVCRAMGLPARHCGLWRIPGMAEPSGKRASPQIILHDVDEDEAAVRQSVTSLRDAFPRAHMLAWTCLPQVQAQMRNSDLKFDAVVPRLDFLHGLQWTLRNAMPDSSAAVT